MILPDLIELNDYNGDFASYLEAVYNVFKKDFVHDKPYFKGKKLALKKHPVTNGKEYTFYHLTHSGPDEKNRTPDMVRMARIGYPKPIIDNSGNISLKVWRNERKNKSRILLFHEKENYLVILEDRKKYILPWTAYYINYRNSKKKLLKEYNNYKAKTAL